VLRPLGGGDAVTVLGPGRHFHVPWPGRVLRMPREPIPASRDFALPVNGGTVTVSVAGSFAVAEGGEVRFVKAAGFRPFLDGLFAVLEAELRKASEGRGPLDLYGWAAETRLEDQVRAALEAAGARTVGLRASVSAEQNPKAAAALQARLDSLARPTKRKVLVVGWDGADWLMIRPLMAAGRMPNLSRLVASGASGELRSQKPLLSPLLWTTMATGKTVPEHGIADFLVKDRDTGDLVPIGSDARRVHALWTILPAFGLRTNVVAWWATGPAERTKGTLVTDRVAYQLFNLKEDPNGEGKVSPPNAWGWVREKLVGAEDVKASELRRFVDVDADEMARLWDSLPKERRQENRVNHLRKILATTRSYHAIARELVKEHADLTLVYYEGTDTVGHLFARFLPPIAPGVTPDEVRRFGHALPEFYAYADELLGQLVADAEPGTTVILVSDHGFFTSEARPAADPSDFTTGAPQWHRLHGILVAAGGGVAHREVRDASLLDIAPTVLALLGLPVPADMPGRVLEPLLPAGVVTPGSRPLASYQALPRPAAGEGGRSRESDEERLRELAALGYISSDAVKSAGRSSAAGANPASSVPAAGGSTQAVATEAYNLGRIKQQQGDLTGAAAQYKTALDRLPTFGLAWVSLAQVASLEGRHADAFDVLARGFGKSADMPPSGITGLVDEAKQAGRLDEAAKVLAGLRGGYADKPAYHAALGLLAEERGDVAGGLTGYEKALAMDPVDQLSIERAIALLRRQGRDAEARQRLATALESAGTSIETLNHLAIVCLRQGWPKEAEAIFRKVLKSDPGNPGVLANLSACLAQQGRPDEAAEMLKDALRREPDNAQNHYNLGAILAERGRTAEALASFQAAFDAGLRGARVRLALAKMHFRLGHKDKCRSELEAVLGIEPGNADAREMLALLGR